MTGDASINHSERKKNMLHHLLRSIFQQTHQHAARHVAHHVAHHTAQQIAQNAAQQAMNNPIGTASSLLGGAAAASTLYKNLKEDKKS